MTQRERILAFAVGGVLAIVLLQWGFTKFKDARSSRDQQIAQLEAEVQNAELVQAMGLDATERMEGFIARSLPSDADRAGGEYAAWLLGLMEASGVRNVDVKNLNYAAAGGTEVYRVFSYRGTATGTMEEIVWLLHTFHLTDYLHRIRTLEIKPSAREIDQIDLVMELNVLALNEAAPDQPPPGDPSPLVAGDYESYAEPILDRNLFSPPNEAPRYEGGSSIEAIANRPLEFRPQFDDPEGDDVRIRLVGDVPEGVDYDSDSGRILVRRAEPGVLDLTIEATDDGRPRRTITQPLTVKVVEEPEEVVREMEFDNATQAFLTALVYSRGQWTAWMTVRTLGKKEVLRKGDEFEVGSVKGTVVDVTQRFIEIEVDQRRTTLGLNDSLAEAVERSQVN